MPMTRSPRCADIASVTMPAGLVKLMTQASGASSATRCAIRVITGIVRSPYEMPPAPTVSCPSTPASSATRSSMTRPSSPRTRTALKTKSTSASAESRSVVTETEGASGTSRACSANTRPIAASRLASTSYSVTWLTRPSAWSERSAR